MMKSQKKQYVVCVKNEGYEVSLERRKIYRIVPDKKATEHHLMRIRDESGKAYFYPEDYFIVIKLAPSVSKALAA